MRPFKRRVFYGILGVIFMLSFMSVRSVRAAENNPYPTVVIADYILDVWRLMGKQDKL